MDPEEPLPPKEPSDGEETVSSCMVPRLELLWVNLAEVFRGSLEKYLVTTSSGKAAGMLFSLRAVQIGFVLTIVPVSRGCLLSTTAYSFAAAAPPWITPPCAPGLSRGSAPWGGGGGGGL